MSSEGADGWRDALAILAAVLRDDHEAIGSVILNCNAITVIPALGAMVFNTLREHGIDPAEWVAEQQARARDELSE